MSLETSNENKEIIFVIKNNQEITIKKLKDTLNLGKKVNFIFNESHIEISTQDINDICKLVLMKTININGMSYPIKKMYSYNSSDPASWN